MQKAKRKVTGPAGGNKKANIRADRADFRVDFADLPNRAGHKVTGEFVMSGEVFWDSIDHLVGSVREAAEMALREGVERVGIEVHPLLADHIDGEYEDYQEMVEAGAGPVRMGLVLDGTPRVKMTREKGTKAA